MSKCYLTSDGMDRDRPRSQGIFFDLRDETARITKALIQRVDVFKDMTETVRSTISNRSLKLFTFSGIYHATRALLAGKQDEPYLERLAFAVDFWTEVAKLTPDWRRAKSRELSPAELRRKFIHSHAIALAALGRVGSSLAKSHPHSWKRKLRPLRTLSWARSNATLWEGRAMVAGRLSKTSVSIVLTGNAIKRHMEMVLDSDESAIEQKLVSKLT